MVKLPKDLSAVVYLEFDCGDEGSLETITEKLGGLLEKHGGSLDDSWAGFDEED